MKTILLMAVTLDGKIAKHAAHPATWTSGADKKMFVAETKQAGVLIMGQTTYDTIGRPLPGRLNVIMNTHPDQSKNIPGLLEFTSAQPAQLLSSLNQRGFETIFICGGATINGLFLKENLINEIWLTIEPKIFGDGLSLFKNADVNLDLQLISVEKISDDVLHVRYQVKK